MNAMVLLSKWNESQIEFWRKTKYEGYDVSSFGRVRSWLRRGARGKRDLVPHLLSGSLDSHGYVFVELGRGPNNERRRFWVHREVALTFIDNPDTLPEVNHRTGLKIDNRIDNFEWVSDVDNIQHSWDVGLRENARLSGERNWRATITESDVRSIRQRRLNGERPVDIAKDYSSGTVKHVLAGRTWKHLL